MVSRRMEQVPGPKAGGSEETILTINVGIAINKTSKRQFKSPTDYITGLISTACTTCCNAPPS